MQENIEQKTEQQKDAEQEARHAEALQAVKNIGKFSAPSGGATFSTPAEGDAVSSGGNNKKIVIISILSFIILLSIGATLFFLLSDDDKPPQESMREEQRTFVYDYEFLPVQIVVPDKDNLFFCIKKSSDLMVLPKEKYIREYLEESDFAVLESIVKDNEDVFTSFNKCSNFEIYQDPDYKDVNDFWIGSILNSRPEFTKLGMLILVRARYLSSLGKWSESFDESFKVIKMGHLIENSQGSMILYLVGIAMKSTAIELMRGLIANADLSVDILKGYIINLDDYKGDRIGLANALKMEFMAAKNTKNIVLDGGGNENTPNMFGSTFENVKASGLDYDSYETSNILSEHFKRQINNTLISYYKDFNDDDSYLDKIEIPQSEEEQKEIDNVIGKIYLRTSLVSFPGAQIKSHVWDFSVSATQILLAIKAYWQDNQKIPSELANLVPNYLDEIPIDPFDGKPLRYVPEKMIIYSVGEDLIDSGGSVKESGISDNTEPTVAVDVF